MFNFSYDNYPKLAKNYSVLPQALIGFIFGRNRRGFLPGRECPGEYRIGDLMSLKPQSGASDHLEQRCVGGGWFQIGFRLSVAHPRAGCARVCIDGHIVSSLLREKRKPVDQREILADVVGTSFKRSGMEDALAGANPHAPDIPPDWIARAGGVDCRASVRISGKAS